MVPEPTCATALPSSDVGVGVVLGARTGVLAPGVGRVGIAAGGSFGWLCFCHAFQRRTAEKEKIMTATMRWVSIVPYLF
jgi:hypothetical protein